MIKAVIAEVHHDMLQSCDIAVTARLIDCLPSLEAALTNAIERGEIIAEGHRLLGAASTRNGIVTSFGTWPDVDRFINRYEPADIAATIAQGIDSNRCDLVTAGLTVLLKKDGMARHDKQSVKIIRSGRRPLSVLLVAVHGAEASFLATMSSLPNVSVN